MGYASMEELLGAAEDVRHLILVETISILDVVIVGRINTDQMHGAWRRY